MFAIAGITGKVGGATPRALLEAGCKVRAVVRAASISTIRMRGPCGIPCPCEFAQAPTDNACMGMLAWHVREGRYGDTRLDGFNLLALGGVEGNLWAGEGKARIGLFIDERADDRQREALQAIFAGQAGGWPATFAANITTGVMSLAWMLLLTLVVFVEKLFPHGRRTAAVSGVALVVLGLLVAAGAVPMPWMA